MWSSCWLWLHMWSFVFGVLATLFSVAQDFELRYLVVGDFYSQLCVIFWREQSSVLKVSTSVSPPDMSGWGTKWVVMSQKNACIHMSQIWGEHTTLTPLADDFFCSFFKPSGIKCCTYIILQSEALLYIKAAHRARRSCCSPRTFISNLWSVFHLLSIKSHTFLFADKHEMKPCNKYYPFMPSWIISVGRKPRGHQSKRPLNSRGLWFMSWFMYV